jgi:ABC-type Fe3+ transport system substrate-binding protein
MTTTVDHGRRHFLGAGLAGAAGLMLPVSRVQAAPQTVTVLTSYPEETLSRFEAAFEKAHPQLRLRTVWRMPREALPYLRAEGQNGVDVYWAASPRTFALLAQEQRLAPLGVSRDGLPDRIGNTALIDAQSRYAATEIAGFGFVVNPAALRARGLTVPQDWSDLADARYEGALLLPSPARVGFAPPMVEIVLQAWSWELGWALWSEIAGNAAPLERGSTFVTDEVSSGRRPIGLTIDFFTASAIANGAPLAFHYPRHGGVNPAHVAITASAPNPDGARAFARFVLSPAGQKILAHPDIRKLPVRPDVYEGLPAGQYNPFATAAQGGLNYDAERAAPRIGLSVALFEQMLMVEHAELGALWRRIHAAEAAGKSALAARRLLSTPLLSEHDAADEGLRRLFHERVETQAGDDARTVAEEGWRQQARTRRQEVARLLTEAGA